MFDRLLGKFKKVSFQVPEKNFNYDAKTVTKLSSKDLILLSTQQDKYITVLLKKFESVKDDYGRLNQKVDQLTEKNQIINQQTIRMSNQHEQLSVKFNNLQNALQMTLRQKQADKKNKHQQVSKPKEHEVKNQNISKIIDTQFKTLGLNLQLDNSELKLKQILNQFKYKSELIPKIESQNAKLKEKIQELEANCFAKQESEKNNKQVLENMRNQLEIKDKEITTINQNISLLKQDNLKISQLTSKMKQIQQKHTTTLSQKYKLQVKTSELELQIVKKDKEIDSSKKQIKRLEQFIQNMEQGADNQDKQQFVQINQLRSKLSQLQTNTEQQITLKNKRIQQMQQQLETLNASLKSSLNSIAQLQMEVSSSSQNKIKLLKQLDQLKETVQTVSIKLATSEQQLLHLKNRSNNQQNSLKDSIKNMTKQLKEKQILISQLQHKLQQQQTSGKSIQSERLSEEKEKQIYALKQQIRKRESEHEIVKAELIKNMQEYSKQISKKNEEIQQTNRKLRKLQNEQSTSNIKIDSLKKTIEKHNDQMKSSKQSMQKIYQENVMKIEKISQLEEKVKEYKRQIQKQKGQKIEIQQMHEIKINQLKSTIQQNIQNIETTKRESTQEHQVKEAELEKRIKRLEQELEDSGRQTQSLQKQLNELKQSHEKAQITIKDLSIRRQQAILQIQRLQKLSGQTPKSQNKSMQMPNKQKIESKDKQRSHKIAQKAYKAVSIILKQLQALYKQFINQYITELKQQRATKIQSAINQLITKTTDMKDVFKDYL